MKEENTQDKGKHKGRGEEISGGKTIIMTRQER